MKKLLSYLFFFLLLPSVVFATTLYVRTDGHDTSCNGLYNASAASAPNCAYLTITKAESALTTGSHTVNIAAGTYPEQVTINISGSSESNRLQFVGSGTVSVRAIKLVGASYVTLSGLTIGWTGNSYPWSECLFIDSSSNYNIVSGCIIDGYSTTGLEGVTLSGDHNLITGSTVKNIDNTYFIAIGDQDRAAPGSNANTVTLSILKDGTDTDAFRIHGTNHTISYNEVYNLVGTGVERNHGDFVQWFPNDNNCSNSYDIQNIMIFGNLVHDTHTQLFYGNNVCSDYGTVVDNIMFYNNVFYNIGMHGQDYGDPQTNIRFYNNVFHKVGYLTTLYGDTAYNPHAFVLGSQTNSGEIKNNVFLECSKYGIDAQQGWYATQSGIVKSNNYVAGPSYTAKSTSYFTEAIPPSINGGNPYFVDEANHDYRLSVNSPLIGAGATISYFSIDKDGNPRTGSWDIGAYEYTGVDSTPPTVSSASVNGSTVTINFSETVVTTGYDAGDFNLDCTSPTLTDVALSSPSGSGSSRTFTAATAIVYGQTCNLDYVGSTDDIEDSSGNDLVAFSNTAVTNNTPGTDTTPDAFTFTDITNATRSTVYTSNTITVAGINASTTVSVSNGTYSKNGAAYTSSAGTAVLGDTFSVRHTSSASYSTAVSTVLTIGGVSDTYTTTTLADAGDVTAPVCTITSPTSSATYSTSSSTVSLSGTATDAVGVTSVTWANDRGGSGTATCTGCTGTSVTWSQADIALYSGVNVLTISARDAANNTGTDTLTVTYTPVGDVPSTVRGVTLRGVRR